MSKEATIREKFEWVAEVSADHLGMTIEERSYMFGGDGDISESWSKLKANVSYVEIERRCDSIHRIFTNVMVIQVIGKEDKPDDRDSRKFHALWFRTPIPMLGNHSPLEYVRGRGLRGLTELMMLIESPETADMLPFMEWPVETIPPPKPRI